ncbi:hypothetical protein [Coprobacter fastidiosus]|uniref:hypothetical protein n=1 Tax=Coprobacter fastidiosus TaxID=1099853 RepID=UPI003A8D6058
MNSSSHLSKSGCSWLIASGSPFIHPAIIFMNSMSDAKGRSCRSLLSFGISLDMVTQSIRRRVSWGLSGCRRERR